MICFAAVPSPKGLVQFVGVFSIFSVACSILSGFVPASVFAPVWMVSGRSVLSRSVMHGVLRMHASSCTPPESVRMSCALDCSMRKSRYPTGSMSWMFFGLMLYWFSIFFVRG